MEFICFSFDFTVILLSDNRILDITLNGEPVPTRVEIGKSARYSRKSPFLCFLNFLLTSRI